jgi:hypothetical protein
MTEARRSTKQRRTREHDPRIPEFRPPTIEGQLPIEPLMGEADATAEWGDTGRGHAVFLHTPSYDAVKRPNTLFIFGRRGTGKTAVLRMLQYEVRHGTGDAAYLGSWVVDQVSAFTELGIMLRSGPFASLPDHELEHVAAMQWGWLATVAAMCGTLWQAERGQAGKIPDPMKGCATDLAAIRRYLASERIFEATGELTLAKDPLRALADMVLEVVDGDLGEMLPTEGKYVAGAVRAVAKLTRKLREPKRADAEDALFRIVRSTGRVPLVLVDSVDEYLLTDNVSRAVTAGLIRTALESYTRPGLRVFVKCAFPSEIYPHLRLYNPEKVAQSSCFILWHHRDLVSLVAKRYRYYTLAAARDGAGEVEDDTSLDDPKAAEDFLESFLPAEVTLESGVRFATMSYVLRHTQKKPRQVIALFNAILSLAKLRGLAPAAELTEEIVVKGIRSHLGAIAEGVYQVYELVYPEATRIVTGTLNRRPATFRGADLDLFIKDISAVRNRVSLTVEEVKGLLVESGIVGRVIRVSLVKGKRRCKVAQALFQYQMPTRMPMGHTDLLAIHPLFYEQFATEATDDVFVYPVAGDEEPNPLRSPEIGMADDV